MKINSQLFYRVDMAFLVSLLVVSFSGIVVWGWAEPNKQVRPAQPTPPSHAGGPAFRQFPPGPFAQPNVDRSLSFVPNDVYAQEEDLDNVLCEEDLSIDNQNLQEQEETVDVTTRPNDSSLKSLEQIRDEFLANYVPAPKQDTGANTFDSLPGSNRRDVLENNPNVAKASDLKPKFFWGLVCGEKFLRLTKENWSKLHRRLSVFMIVCLFTHVYIHKEWLATQTIKALQEEEAQYDEDEE